MSLGRCPKCKSRVRRSFYRFFCDTCKVELSETMSSTIVMMLIGVVTLLAGVIIGYFGTLEIVNTSENSEHFKDLIVFYLKILGGMILISLMLEHIFLKLFASFGDLRT